MYETLFPEYISQLYVYFKISRLYLSIDWNILIQKLILANVFFLHIDYYSL